MKKRFRSYLDFFVRNSEAGHLLEIFFVSAVSSILAIRFFLKLTGYPQIGGEGLHIAHLLWGGLLLTIATLISLIYLNREAKSVTAVLGGIGFGVFIDELGKFVTSDNDYFFQPTIAIIYVIFVLLFLLYRYLERKSRLTEEENVLNALEITKDMVTHSLSRAERRRALTFLEKSGSNDAITKALEKLVRNLGDLPVQQESYYEKAKDFFQDLYGSLIERAWFTTLLIVVFVLISFLSLLRSLFVIASQSAISFAEWGHIIFSIFSGLLVLVGIYYLRRSRLAAFHLFKVSLLLSVFLTQFFLFFTDQLSALLGLGTSLLLLGAIQYLIEQERITSKNPRG